MLLDLGQFCRYFHGVAYSDANNFGTEHNLTSPALHRATFNG